MARRQRAAAAAVILGSMAMVCAAPPAKFDGGKAYEHVRQLVGIGPRPAGSAALDATRRYITEQLAAVGVKAAEQAFTAETPLGMIRMANVIATIPGARPDRIVFGGHVDTKLYREFRFVGANDGGSSAAFLIELARVLKARANPFTVEIVFFDGEESMLPNWGPGDNTYGSRHYVDAAKKAGKVSEIRAFLLVDMIGDRDLDIAREGESTTWLTDLIWVSARRLGYEKHFLNDVEPIGGDDHFPFLEAGIPAVDIIDFHYPPWHTAADTLDKVSARSLQIVGDVVLDALPAIEDRLAKKAPK
jgi:Zn-dependent M28 family amino/carboxypeptidase